MDWLIHSTAGSSVTGCRILTTAITWRAQAFDLQDYDTAIAHLKFAVRQKKTEDRFFALLGLSYLRRGDPEAARVWITRAEEAAGNSELRSGYHSKLELLQRANRG